MTSPSTPPQAQLHRQMTDALHAILHRHLQTTHAQPRASAFHATRTQQDAQLMQALQRAQRNL